MNTREKHAPEQPEPPVSDEMAAEVRRRLDEYARDGQRGRPWDQVLADQRRKLAGPR